VLHLSVKLSVQKLNVNNKSAVLGVKWTEVLSEGNRSIIDASTNVLYFQYAAPFCTEGN